MKQNIRMGRATISPLPKSKNDGAYYCQERAFARMLRLTSLVLFAGLTANAVAQQAATNPATPTEAAQTGDASSQKPSALITPALYSVGKAGSSVDLNKWKGSNAMRSEVDANLSSIQKDLQNTLPPLIDTSDATPASAAAALPVLLNLDALYSVLLRVAIASRSGAPKDQNADLEQAAITLDNARRDLGNRITATVAANEKKLGALQATVQQQATAIQAAQAPPPPPPAPAKPVVRKKKPAPKPATAPAATPTKPAQ